MLAVLIALLLASLASMTAAATPAARVYPAAGAIAVDGVLDEPGWAAAVPVTDFLRYTPAEGGAPAGTTQMHAAVINSGREAFAPRSVTNHSANSTSPFCKA